MWDERRGSALELARGEGCQACQGSGYAGREVIAEMLVMTPKVRALILKQAPEKEVQEMARTEGMKTLREQGLEKAIQHHTTLEEVFRTTVGDTIEG